MYTLIRNVRVREGLLVEVPSFILSLLVAELFYKFHSFTLECAAFLATWLAISFLGQRVSEARSTRKDLSRSTSAHLSDPPQGRVS
jgi:hypothetical protein